jgi:hypothetical protein
MSAPNPDNVAAFVSDIANALQVAAPAAARVRERADALQQHAERLEAAIERAATAVRQLEPPAHDP